MSGFEDTYKVRRFCLAESEFGEFDGFVYKTNDPGIFHRLEANRRVTEQRVKSISDSVKRVGWLPIPVIANENLETIDGQGRIEVAKRMNLPVWFTIAEGAGIEECRSVNSGTSKWTRRDYVESYAESGNGNYANFMRLLDKYEKAFTFSGVQYAIDDNNSGKSGNLENGNLFLDDAKTHEVDVFLGKLLCHITSINKVPGRKCIVVLMLRFVLSCDGVSEDRVFSILDRYYDMIRADKKSRAVEDFQKLYNNHLSARNRVEFASILSRQGLKEAGV